jgi:hypothetical protein
VGGCYLIVLEDIGWEVPRCILLAKDRDQRQVIVETGIKLADL